MRIYFLLTNKTCKLDESTGIWSVDLPVDFVNAPLINKTITVLTFMYYGTWVPRTDDYIDLQYTSFHSPTLCDGNFSQNDYYISSLSYNYNTVHKTYEIGSMSQKLEFFFKDAEGEVIKKFYFKKGESGYDDREYEERFVIELQLDY